MNNIKRMVMDFYRDEEGASGIEYAMIAAMAAVVLAGFVPGIRTAVSNIFTSIQTSLTTNTGNTGN
jgi:pilus assembly protein Flp/PilA